MARLVIKRKIKSPIPYFSALNAPAKAWGKACWYITLNHTYKQIKINPHERCHNIVTHVFILPFYLLDAQGNNKIFK